MEHYYTDAVEYIHDHLAHGFTEQQIRDHFLQSGWTNEHVNQAMQYANAAMRPNEPTPVSQPLSKQSAQLSPQPTKYGVFRSIADGMRAIKHNLKAYLIIQLVSIGILAVVDIFITILVFSAFISALVLGGKVPRTGLQFLVVALVVYLLVVFLITLLGSLLGLFASKVLADGANRVASQPTQILASSFREIRHVGIVHITAFIIAFGPPIALQLIALALAAVFLTNPLILILALLTGIATTVWIVIIALRTILIGQVAIFEQQLTARQVVKRSSHLLMQGGQWFAIKAIALGIVIVLILSSISDAATHGHNLLASIIVTVLAIAFYLVAEAVLTMLYLNRVAIRGN